MASVFITGSADGLGRLAAQRLVTFGHDVVLHGRLETPDGLETTFAVNALAPCLLTALIASPQWIVFLTSELHRSGEPDLSGLQWRGRRWSGSQAYSNSKLFVIALAFGVARRWPHVLSNAVNPGWVPTKVGGPRAPDDLALSAETQVWLAVSGEPDALVSGKYLYHKQIRSAHPAASDVNFQNQLLDACARLTGVELS